MACTCDLYFVPAIASFPYQLVRKSVSYLVIKFGNFCNWSHKHVFYTRWLLILFLLLFYFREEKNVALAELRDELLASKKSLESLRQEVSKKKKNSDGYQSSWSSAVYQWKGWRSCMFCVLVLTPYVIPGPNLFTCVTFSLLNCHVMLLLLFMLSRLLDFTRFWNLSCVLLGARFSCNFCIDLAEVP